MRARPAWLAFVALALSSCGPSAKSTAGGRDPSEVRVAPPTGSAMVTKTLPGPKDPNATLDAKREERLIARMLKRVTRARGIDAKKGIPGVVLSRADLIARVKEHVAKEIPPEAIRNEGNVLKLFGFIPTRFDYEAAEFALLEAQLAGYYEPADGTMYMAADLGDADADATLAHELVHALQDQRWDLKARSRYRPGDGDRSSAVSALAEGDATSAMFDVMLAMANKNVKASDLPDETFSEQIRESMNTGPTAGSPHIMRSSLAAPYIYGTLFVNALRRRKGWDDVNRAWDDAPTTSEQILHVDKWDAREIAAPLSTPVATSLGAGWSVADADVYGELGVRLTFEEWMADPADAAIAAAGWGGDRGVLLQNGERVAFAWRIRFDDAPGQSDAFAKRAFDAVASALRKSASKTSITTPTFFCFERPDRGPFAIARSGKEIVFVAGPATIAAGTWSSAGTCSLAKTWTAEISKSP